MTYREALDYIASLAPRGWRLGLDRMAEFGKRSGLAGGPKYVHIAGTNGKGTVTAFVQSLLVEHGVRTGAFYSPFVYDPRERFQFGREYISEEALADLTERLIPVAEAFSHTAYGGITEFEFKTGLGLLFFEEMACEWVALEVGLGGRLDATNIVTPTSCVISSIGLDHTSVLGNSHEEIAYEKAGIIKSGAPCVVGHMPKGALAPIRMSAEDSGSDLWFLGREILLEGSAVVTPAGRYEGLEPQLRGGHVHDNMALAISALDAAGFPLEASKVALGVRAAAIPGRFETRLVDGKRLVLDGAHNAEAAQSLTEGLAAEYPGKRLVLLTGMVQGHDPARFYQWFRDVKASHCAAIDFHRTLTAAEVAAAAPRGVAHASVKKALEAALEDTGPDDVLVVTGSFYLLGEVGRLLASAYTL